MNKELTELERLDMAARAEVARSSLRGASWSLGALGAWFVILAIGFKGTYFKATVMDIAAIAALLAALFGWVQLRGILHRLVMLIAGFAITALVLGMELNGWLALTVAAAYFADITYTLVRQGVLLAAAHGKGWEKERAQVRQWLNLLSNFGTEDPVFEISIGNFWVGYYNYRIMKRDEEWAVVRLKRGNYLRPLDYRILPAGAVTITQLPDGKFYVQMGKRTLREVRIDPDMQASLLRLTSAN